MRFFLTIFVACCALDDAWAQQGESSDVRLSVQFFENRVRPILSEHCYQCHGPKKQQANLRLDSRTAILTGGDSGPAIEPGKPDASLLVSAINHGDIVQMPPQYKLQTADIDALTTWVKVGSPWPETARTADGVAEAAVKNRTDYRNQPAHSDTESKSRHDPPSKHWSMIPPIRPKIPVVKNAHWPKNEIDRFILSKLEHLGIEPVAMADKRSLVRRMTYDLHGLPPTPESVQQFLNDDHPEAVQRLVERLLAAPRYGEHWGRHWLDVARYADSNGGDENRIHAHAWRYRDYVIESFNQDVPFDRFAAEQLAGDLLDAQSSEERYRLWIATGLLAIGPKPLLANDAAKVEMDVVDELIETVGRAFLGLSLGCARCHDHKFDPITLDDYYALAGIFKSTQVVDRFDVRICRTWTEKALGSEMDDQHFRELKEKAAWCDDMRRLSDANSDQRKYIKQMEEVRAQMAPLPVAMAVRDSGTISDARVHLRGNPQTLGNLVHRGFPQAIECANQPAIPTSQSGRLELARWMVNSENPLTARVVVNRVWRWHMGEGIVWTPDDFGVMGARPDNQQLLDYLAMRFVDKGWSIKWLHRLIMGSAAYQLSSRGDARSLARDPENRLRWRMNRRRLEAGEIRDSLLSLGGALDLAVGGSLLPPLTNHEQFSKVQNQLKQAYTSRQRAVYLPVVRSGMYDLFQAFDFADPSVTSGRRSVTTVAPQALFLMNSELVWQACQFAAERLYKEGSDEGERVRRLYSLAFGRTPNPSEADQATTFLRQYREQLAIRPTNEGTASATRIEALEALCHAIVMTNEFLYVH